MYNYQLSIDRRTIAKVLATTIAFLLVASLAGQVARLVFDHDYVFGLVDLFNVDTEQNIPTFFTMLVALSNVALFIVIGLGSRQRDKREVVYWFALAAGFLFLTYDEAFQVHEKMNDPMRKLLGGGHLGFLNFSWVVPGLIGAAVVALLFLRFLLRLPASTRNPMLLAAALYLGGCLGMELIDGKYAEMYGLDPVYMLMTHLEEGLEMSGMAMLVFALLGHIATVGGRLDIRLPASQAALEVPSAQMEFN